MVRPSRLFARLRHGGTLLALLLIAACGGGSDDPPTPKPAVVSTVRVTPSSGTVDIGSTLQLASATLDAQGTAVVGQTVTWTSLTPATATVNASGVVTGVAAGTVIINATAAGVTGSATIAVVPPVSARCDATTPIELGTTVTGSLSGTDCRLSDDTYADKYVLTLADSTPVRVLMTSALVDAYLIIQDAVSGQLVAENDDGNGDTGSQIERMLPAGRYVIAANTFEANQFGEYRLTVARTSSACLRSTPTTSPRTITGTLAATACQLADSSYTDRYLLNVRSSILLTATMRSDVLDSYLYIESTTGVSIGRNDNGGGGTDARVQAALDPGEYIINANSAKARETGAYTLTLSSVVDPCGTSSTLTVGQVVADTLATGGCKLVDGSFIKRYAVTLAAPTPLRIDVTSTVFDPYLIVQESGSGTTVAEDDDDGPGLNAQVLQVFPAGTYVITATSATPGELGAFTIAISGAEAGSVGVAVAPATVTLTPGLTQQLTATVTGATNTSVAWKSSAPNIAAVSATGVVRAITAGAATITATSAADPSKTGTAAVTVNAGTDANLDLPLVYLTQSVQTQDSRIPLVAGRPTIARIFVRGSRSGLGNAPVRLRIFNGATETGALTGTAVVATALDEVCCSADIVVPAALVRDGMTVIADVDPANTIAESNEGDNAWPLTGASKPIKVVTVPPINIQLVPIRHNTTGNVGPDNTSITDLIKRMYPLGTVNVTVHAEYATDTPPLTDGTSWIAMLREMEGLRALENGRAYYYGVLHQVAANGIIGIATLRGFAGVGIGGPSQQANETLTHEFGHSFGRNHAPSPDCGAPANVDASYPRADGTIGAYGYDILLSAVIPASRHDIMGYCNDVWASDYTYLGVMDYVRSGVIPLSIGSTTPVPVLMISGSYSDGQLTVDPVFSHTGTPTTPRSTGRFIAEGLAADGRVLFRHRFDGSEVGDAAPEARTFLLEVPYDASVSGAVASISVRDVSGAGQPAMRVRAGTYSGLPNGVSLRVDADPQLAVSSAAAGRYNLAWNAARYPSVVVRNRRTGQVLAIARRGTLSFGTPALADVEVLLSDGVSSVTRPLSIGGAP